MKQRLVVVGNGMAGAAAVQEILARGGQDRFDIVIFGDETHGHYDRTQLSQLLSGKKQMRDLVRQGTQWYARHGITLHAGAKVTHVDRMSKWVHATSAGVRRPYDKLILATGSRPFLPPIEGLTGERGSPRSRVYTYRTLDDCRAIRDAAQTSRRAAVLGGGLLGLEAARAMLDLGIEVHVVQMAPWLLNAQLDEMASGMLARAMEKIGVHVHLGKVSTRVLGDERLEGLAFEDGTILECDMVVVTAGVRPNTELGLRSGLAVERALVVDNHMRSRDDPHIYVVGECAQHRGRVYTLLGPIEEQARVLADHITQTHPQAAYTGSKLGTRLNVPEVDLVCMGVPEPTEPGDEVVQYAEPERCRYRKLVIRQERLVGAIALGDLGRVDVLERAFETNSVLPVERLGLLFDLHAVAPAE